jgi:hypothetical protein
MTALDDQQERRLGVLLFDEREAGRARRLRRLAGLSAAGR